MHTYVLMLSPYVIDKNPWEEYASFLDNKNSSTEYKECVFKYFFLVLH